MRDPSLNIDSPDLLLTNKLKEGSSFAFDLIFVKYYENLCRFAFSVLHDPDISQDLVQNVFLTLWNRRNVSSQIQNLPAYLTTMVKNQVSDYLKDKKVNLHEVSRKYDLSDNSTENEILGRDFEECLVSALSRLPDRCRQAFEYSRFENLTNREIAVRMDISVKGVEALIGRALKSLRIDLQEFLPSSGSKNKNGIFLLIRLSKKILQELRLQIHNS